MSDLKINKYILKIIGLLGDVNPKKDFTKFLNNGYKRDLGPVDDEKKKQILRDYFYPNFRKIMFLDDTESGNHRFIKHNFSNPILLYKSKEYELNILSSEIFVFEEHFGIFSISFNIELDDSILQLQLEDFSNVSSILRNFSTKTNDNLDWHHWISKNILCDTPLRGEGVKADDYSGSKFKLFMVVDIDHEEERRSKILYDLATTSPLGSAEGKTFLSPDTEFFNELMQNRIAAFRNWEAIALFDSFTSVGQGHLSYGYEVWNETYFRIYLYRLFFKYNLYRYNSAIHSDKNEAIFLRDQFEGFLNKYNISHMSFNFLANDIFKKVGIALELESELVSFRETINNLSKIIQEEKQARTNFLLQAVTILTSITSLGPIFDLMKQVEVYLGWSEMMFYTVLSIIVLILGFGAIYFLMPEKINRLWKSKK